MMGMKINDKTMLICTLSQLSKQIFQPKILEVQLVVFAHPVKKIQLKLVIIQLFHLLIKNKIKNKQSSSETKLKVKMRN